MSTTSRSDSAAAVRHQPCPRCGHPVPLLEHYVTWCDQCDWNLTPPASPQPQTLFDSFYVSLGTTLSAQLFADLRQATAVAPRLTLTSVLAFTLAALVHAVTLACAVLGVVILVAVFPNPFPSLLGIVLLLCAWMLRPRLGKLPLTTASRDRFPTLYAITQRIADILGAPPIHALAIDAAFNAHIQTLGWRRQQLITIGLPLFAILTPEERVAILAHEVAHRVNGDHRRGFVVASAISALNQWYQLLRPDRIWGDSGRYRYAHTPAGGLTYLAGAIANAFLLGISAVPWLASYTLSHLVWRNMQRAEYLADALAAQVSGTTAMLSALEKLHYAGVVNQTVQSLTLQAQDNRLVPLLRAQVAALPAQEIERIRRINARESARLDLTHPPTSYRIALLQAHPVNAPRLILTAEEAAQLERELMTMQAPIQRELIDRYRRHLYY